MVWRTCCEKTEALLLDLTECWVRGQHPLLLCVPPMGLTSCTAIPLHPAFPHSSFAMTASPPRYTNTSLGQLPEVPGITFLPSLAVSAAGEGTSAEVPHGTQLMGSPGLPLQAISQSISLLKNKQSNWDEAQKFT